APALIEHLVEGSGRARLEVPEEVGALRHATVPAPRMTVAASPNAAAKSFDVSIAFHYEGVAVDALDPHQRLFESGTIVTRHREAEAAAIAEALDAGVVFQQPRGRL